MRHLLCLLLAGCPLLTGDPPKPPPIVLPVVAADGPKPPPGPAAGPVRLTPGVLYVVRAQAECVVRCHPPGLVSVKKKAGPREFTSRFVDGTGQIEDRTYDAPVLYVLQASGVGTADIDVIPLGLKAEAEIVSTVLEVDDGSKPQPPPPPPVNPPDVTTPSKLVAVIVEETAEAVAGRGAMLADPKLAALMKAKGHTFRVVDKEVAGPDGKPPADVARFLTLAAGKALPQLYLVDAKGKARYAGPAPTTAAKMIELMTQAGG